MPMGIATQKRLLSIFGLWRYGITQRRRKAFSVRPKPYSATPLASGLSLTRQRRAGMATAVIGRNIEARDWGMAVR